MSESERKDRRRMEGMGNEIAVWEGKRMLVIDRRGPVRSIVVKAVKPARLPLVKNSLSGSVSNFRGAGKPAI